MAGRENVENVLKAEEPVVSFSIISSTRLMTNFSVIVKEPQADKPTALRPPQSLHPAGPQPLPPWPGGQVRFRPLGLSGMGLSPYTKNSYSAESLPRS